MKKAVEKRKPNGIVDYVALALTTWGVGYIPGAPGTYASVIGVLIFLGIDRWLAPWFLAVDCIGFLCILTGPRAFAFLSTALLIFALGGIWASSRAIPLLGNDDPSEAVVDEVIGQLVTFCFLPFGVGWPFILAGFLLFRFFDIVKPYPINQLQNLPGGLGVCADDIVAGVYAGMCLSIAYAVMIIL